MIAVDTQLSVYLQVSGANTPLAMSVFLRDPEWHAPLLWRSEFRNAILGHIRANELSTSGAIEAYARAAQVIGRHEHAVSTADILSLAEGNRITAYDLEFVVLARSLGVPLVTLDKQVLAEFPGVAMHPEAFLAA